MGPSFWARRDYISIESRDLLILQHIISATFLPRGHKVRWIFATVILEQSLLCESDSIFQRTQQYPTFRADLLEEIRRTLKGLKNGQYVATYKDPLDGREKNLSHFLGYRHSLWVKLYAMTLPLWIWFQSGVKYCSNEKFLVCCYLLAP